MGKEDGSEPLSSLGFPSSRGLKNNHFLLVDASGEREDSGVVFWVMDTRTVASRKISLWQAVCPAGGAPLRAFWNMVASMVYGGDFTLIRSEVPAGRASPTILPPLTLTVGCSSRATTLTELTLEPHDSAWLASSDLDWLHRCLQDERLSLLERKAREDELIISTLRMQMGALQPRLPPSLSGCTACKWDVEGPYLKGEVVFSVPSPFQQPPAVICSLTGEDHHLFASGGSSPYDITAEGFTVYLHIDLKKGSLLDEDEDHVALEASSHIYQRWKRLPLEERMERLRSLAINKCWRISWLAIEDSDYPHVHHSVEREEPPKPPHRNRTPESLLQPSFGNP